MKKQISYHNVDEEKVVREYCLNKMQAFCTDLHEAYDQSVAKPIRKLFEVCIRWLENTIYIANMMYLTTIKTEIDSLINIYQLSNHSIGEQTKVIFVNKANKIWKYICLLNSVDEEIISEFSIHI